MVMERRNVNWGIVSCASIADYAVIPGIQAAGNATLYAISGRNREKLNDFKARHNPVKVYESYNEMLDDPDVDVVYIPLPNGLHHEWVLKAADKKKHILCEKPLGINAEEVEAMKKACDKNGVLLMEAFAYRHSPLTFKVKDLVEKGTIGKLKFIESHFNYMLNDPDNVRLSKELAGGSIYDVGCYNLNIIRYIAGSEPVSVFALGEIDGKSGVDESGCIMLGFDSGLSAVSYCSIKSIDRSEYTIVGENGIIEVPVRFNKKGDTKIIIRTENGTEEINIECPDNYMLEVEQFGRCILNGEKPLITFEDSLGNAKVIDAALRSIFSGR